MLTEAQETARDEENVRVFLGTELLGAMTVGLHLDSLVDHHPCRQEECVFRKSKDDGCTFFAEAVMLRDTGMFWPPGTLLTQEWPRVLSALGQDAYGNAIIHV